eukprot:scaffold44858_cov63-Phaeocystis_antarctica.AAC.2
MAVDVRLCGAAVEHAVEFHVEVLLAFPEVDAALFRVHGQRAAAVRRRADAHEDADRLRRWVLLLRWHLSAVVIADEWLHLETAAVTTRTAKKSANGRKLA